MQVFFLSSTVLFTMGQWGFGGSQVFGLSMLGISWVLVRGLILSCHNKEAILFTTIDPYYGNCNTRTQQTTRNTFLCFLGRDIAALAEVLLASLSPGSLLI